MRLRQGCLAVSVQQTIATTLCQRLADAKVETRAGEDLVIDAHLRTLTKHLKLSTAAFEDVRLSGAMRRLSHGYSKVGFM